jgi:hypothetical protein
VSVHIFKLETVSVDAAPEGVYVYRLQRIEAAARSATQTRRHPCSDASEAGVAFGVVAADERSTHRLTTHRAREDDASRPQVRVIISTPTPELSMGFLKSSDLHQILQAAQRRTEHVQVMTIGPVSVSEDLSLVSGITDSLPLLH